MTRAMVIGLDGASPILIQKWLDRLPNIKKLSDSGTHGILESIVPPASVPAWQCFASGKNPAKLGLFGFASISRDGHRLIKRQAGPELGCLWDICSAQDLRVGVFNVPGTYPPYPLNGFMVCGFPVPPGKPWAYPRELMRRLDEETDGYEIDVPLTKPSEMKGGEDAYLAQVERLHEKSVRSALRLMDWYPSDVFVMTLQAVDMVQHDFWRYMTDSESGYSTVLEDWYVKMDRAVGLLASKAGSDAHILLLSDHGSVPVSMSFHINEYLVLNGLLTLKSGTRVRHKGSVYSRLRELILRNFSAETVNRIYNIAPGFVARRLTTSAKLERFLTDLIENVDWNRSEAFSTGGVQANIYLNGSTVSPRGPAALERIRDLLANLKDPVSGARVRAVFYDRNDVFSGPYTAEAPDVCIELFTRDEKIHINPGLGSGKVWSFEPHLSAEHVREGYWALAGPRVKTGLSANVGILDLAPTLHNLLSIPTVPDLDGKVLWSALKDH